MGSTVKGPSHNGETEDSYIALASQIALVREAIRKYPSRRKEILIRFATNFYEAVKKAIQKHGSVTPQYVILTDSKEFWGPFVTDEVLKKATDINAEGVISVEGFQAKNDISDVIYHVSMSAPSLGVLGWVLKVRLADRRVGIVREMPYLFDSHEQVRTLGQLVAEMEAESEK